MIERDNQPEITQVKEGADIGRVDRNDGKELRRLRGISNHFQDGMYGLKGTGEVAETLSKWNESGWTSFHCDVESDESTEFSHRISSDPDSFIFHPHRHSLSFLSFTSLHSHTSLCLDSPMPPLHPSPSNLFLTPIQSAREFEKSSSVV